MTRPTMDELREKDRQNRMLEVFAPMAEALMRDFAPDDLDGYCAHCGVEFDDDVVDHEEGCVVVLFETYVEAFGRELPSVLRAPSKVPS